MVSVTMNTVVGTLPSTEMTGESWDKVTIKGNPILPLTNYTIKEAQQLVDSMESYSLHLGWHPK